MSLTSNECLEREQLAKALDDLALQLVMDGAATFTQKNLTLLGEGGESAGLLEFAQQAKSMAGFLGAGSSLSDDEAKSFMLRMQSSLLVSPQELTNDAASEPKVVTDLVFEDDPEMLAGFVLEAGEHLLAIEENILLLEKNPALIDKIHAVFRAFHTIKGLAGFLGLSGVQAVAHEVETLLDHARNLRISITPDVVDLVLESSEFLNDEVAYVQAKLNDAPLPPVRDNTQLLRQLSMATNVAMERSLGLPASDAPLLQDVAAVTPDHSSIGLSSSAASSSSTGISQDDVAPSVLVVARAETSGSSVRVETSKLDRLMDMVGEMVIAQTILINNPRLVGREDARIGAEMSQLARITSEVQRCAMSMRLTPIGPLFQKSAKIVRDLSRRNGKKVTLELSGEAIELDKTIAEELSDPLLHMIRNALDHGIETPEERAIAGKPVSASLRIGAEHQGGQIAIFISDDGRGLDAKRILKKAIEKGLVDEHVQLSQEQIFHLIFAPGFSTAEKITDISGRGVGMDVVRQHVERLRGRIEIAAELGKGTTFSIHLPLTLAIIEGLVIVVGSHRYIIPIFSIREMLRPTEDMLFTAQGKNEMILVRGDLLPVVRLHKRFAIQPRTENMCEGLLVVCEFARQQFCLFVDALVGRQEIVIKSLDEAFQSAKGLAGCAILGDGHIGLILDVEGIFHFIDDEVTVAA